MIPIFRPSMGEEEVNAVAEVLKSGWIGLGPKTGLFEKRFAEYIGTKSASGVNSATAALHLAVAALDIKEGDEVLVPAITFISTALVVTYCNAKPVFVDVEEKTLNIDIKDILRKITPKTKAIIVVHFGGHPARMDEINQIARDRGIYVIEDCAHSCGAEYKGRKTGRLGDIGCFSFHAVKNLATGDGGMVVTNDEKVDKRIKRLRWLGIDKDTYKRTGKNYSWYYEVGEAGWKYHMNDITAAIGLVQLAKLDRMNEKRREIVKIYNKHFSKTEGLRLPVEEDYAKSSLHNYVIKLDNRDGLIEYLNKNGIASGVHYMPLHLHPIYRNIKSHLPVAEDIWKKLVTLPLYPDMSVSEIHKVVENVIAFVKGRYSGGNH